MLLSGLSLEGLDSSLSEFFLFRVRIRLGWSRSIHLLNVDAAAARDELSIAVVVWIIVRRAALASRPL
jgi:hypothetical protein